MPDAQDPLELSVAPGIPMLHTSECPHLGKDSLAALAPATTQQLAELPLCSSCEAVLEGGRRRTFSSFEAAMEAFQAPLENRPIMRELASALEFTEIWIPASGSYIAVAPARGVSTAALFHHGYARIRNDDGTFRVVDLPVNSLRSGGRNVGQRLDDPERAVCANCFMQLPTSGVCDNCDS